MIETAKNLARFGCQVTEIDFNCEDDAPPKTKIIENIRLPHIGETVWVRLPRSNPHILNLIKIYRPVSGAIMFGKDGQTHCHECNAQFQPDGLPNEHGIVSTSCPNCSHWGSWLDEIPSGDAPIPVKVDFDLKKERRRAEDRLRKMTENELFLCLKSIK